MSKLASTAPIAGSTQKEPASQTLPKDPAGGTGAVPAKRSKTMALLRDEPPAEALDSSFDIYKFLNEEKMTVTRDPILQQMTVVKYEGEIDNATGFFHGHGKLVSTLGYTYTGNFDRGLMHGQGCIEWTDGVSYEGTFVDNTIHGLGKYNWPCGDWYNGEVANGVRHGKGIFFFKTLNATYEGGWQLGRRHGSGVLKYTGDGAAVEYNGEWEHDKRSGSGTMKYGDQGTYIGGWKHDIREGSGTMSWKRQGIVVEEYRGNWLDGIPSGQGQTTYIRPPPPVPPAKSPKQQNLSANLADMKSGGGPEQPGRESAVNVYQGEYFAGERHGFGTFVYDDGSKYEGQWVHNQKHGEGKYTSGSGVVYVGQFHEGNPVNPISNLKPETTVASPLPLYIRDVLGPSEMNIQEAITSVQSVVSRNNGVFKKCFNFYSNLETGVELVTSPANWKQQRLQGSMTLLQFFRLLNDAKLLNRETSIAAVDRLLLTFSDKHITTNLAAYVTGEVDSVAHLPAPVAGAGGALLSPVAAAASQGAPLVSPSSKEPPQPTPIVQSLSDSQSQGKRLSGAASKTGARSSTSSTKSKEPYHSPWERYKRELHTFQGELNFREFVEALVRLAAFSYSDALYGTLAAKLELLVEEHLAPFTCQKEHASALFAISRSHKSTLSPFMDFFLKLFLHCCQQASLGGAASANPHLTAAHGSHTSPSRSASVAKQSSGSSEHVGQQSLPTCTVRQLALLLKELHVLEDHKFSMTSLMKLMPFDQHPSLTASIYRRRHMVNVSTGSPAAGGAVTTAVLPTPNTTNLSATQQQMGGTQSSVSPSHSERGSVLSLDDAPMFPDGQEPLFRRKVENTMRSRGYQNRNLHSTLAMEAELTYVEFVERLLQVACTVYPTTLSTQNRIVAFIQEKLAPAARKVGYFKPLSVSAQGTTGVQGTQGGMTTSPSTGSFVPAHSHSGASLGHSSSAS